MSLQLCAESIARIQHNRPSPQSSIVTYSRSYRDDYTGSEERPGQRFRVLVAPSEVRIVENATVTSDMGGRSLFPWSYVSTPCRVIRKEESDRNWKGASSIMVPKPDRKGWFLSGEAERIIAAQPEFYFFLLGGTSAPNGTKETLESDDKHESDPDLSEPKRYAKSDHACAPRRITSIGRDIDRCEDKPLPVMGSVKRFNAADFCRRRLEDLFKSKARGEVHDLTEALVRRAKGLSVREIAEEMGYTQGWVKWKLHAISKTLGTESIT
jgi:hypothetical protein